MNLDEKKPDAVKEFEERYADRNLIKLKIIASHFSGYPMNLLAIYIKVLECRYTMERIFSCKNDTCGTSPQNGMFCDICREIMPFCNSKEQNTLQNMLSFYENMENMQEMMQMMELMQESGGFGDMAEGLGNMANLFAGMSGNEGTENGGCSEQTNTPDLSAIFNLFNTFSAN